MGCRALKNGLPCAGRDGAIKDGEVFPMSLWGEWSQDRLIAGGKTRERRSQVPGPMGFAPESAGNPLLCRNSGANGDSCWASSKTKPLQLPASGSASTSPKVLPGGADCPTGAARLHPGDSHPCQGKWGCVPSILVKHFGVNYRNIMIPLLLGKISQSS